MLEFREIVKIDCWIGGVDSMLNLHFTILYISHLVHFNFSLFDLLFPFFEFADELVEKNNK